MAYLRSEKEALEIDYPMSKVWTAIPTVIKTLQWTIEETDEIKHHLKIKTKGGFLSYPSVMTVDLLSVDKKTTKLIAVADTPVTTITSVADYGRTRERLEQFIEALAKHLSLTDKKKD
jgi:hypothetical protein